MEKKDGNEISKMPAKQEPFMKTFSSQEEAEIYRLKKDMERSDMEKFLLFTQMLRRNALYKKAKISSYSDSKKTDARQ